MRPIDGDALFAVVKGHHDLYNGATNPADKARRDECLQVMCDINDAPTVDAIPVEWLRKKREVAIWQFAGAIDWLLSDWQKEQETRE